VGIAAVPISAARPQAHLSQPRYRPDIDGLRAIAVLAVVAFHAFPAWVKGGFIGVDVFFVISGYLISTIIFANLDRGTFNFAEFYARRVKRIFPALILVLVASYAFGWFALLADEYKQLGRHVAAGAGFVSNYVLWNEAGYFDNNADTKPLLHLWSLGIEEQFYIVWPLLLWLAWKARFNPLTITVIVAVSSFYLNLKGIQGNAVATFYSPQTRFWELMSGSVLAWISLHENGAFNVVKARLDRCLASVVYREQPEAGKTLANVLSFFGLFLLAYGFYAIDKDIGFPGKWAAVPVLGAAMLISAGPDAWINRTILSNRVAVWIGLISFPLYLWHWPLLSFARILNVDPPGRELRLALVATSVALAWLTYKLVERPIRLGPYSKYKTPSLLLLMIVAGYVGYNTYARDGLKFRGVIKYVDALYSPASRQAEKAFVSRYKDYMDGDVALSGKPVVLILGDSYVTNWTAGLMAHIDKEKFDVVSAQYMGCDVHVEPLKLSVISTEDRYNENCKGFSARLNNSSVVGRLAAVMLISHRPFEYSANAYRFDVIRWLKKQNKQFELFVFGNYFQLDKDKYPSCEKLMARARQDANICLRMANYPASEPDLEKLPLYPGDLQFKYVDLVKLHCGYNKTGCATQENGVPFMADWNHLNATFIDGFLEDIQEHKAGELAQLGLLKYFKSSHKQTL
jgi:peptidoglycan/LPS O-acetylase OafA/YrhL